MTQEHGGAASRACGSCAYFGAPGLESRGEDGTCRRYPPRVFASAAGPLATAFPKISQRDWCGEYVEHTPSAEAAAGSRP